MDSDESKLESGVAPATKIRRLVYKMSSEQEQVDVVIQNNKNIPRLIIFLNIFLKKNITQV